MKKPFSAVALKMIACITMFSDHMGYACETLPTPIRLLFRILGRVAFPVYCFLLVEGVTHTKNAKKYLLRLFILMLLAEPVFDLMCYRTPVYLQKQSVMVTLLMGAYMCIVMKSMPKFWMRLVMVIPFFYLIQLCRSDYSTGGILMIAMFMLTRDLPKRWLLQIPLFGLLCIYMGSWAIAFPWFAIPAQWFAVLALIPILLYNGKKGSDNRVLNVSMNLFYPVHMAVIIIIDAFLL